LDGIIGVNFAQVLLDYPEEKRKKLLRFYAGQQDLPEDLDEEIAEKRREVKTAFPLL
jgi:predicted CopG family antitoxin